MMIYTGDKFPQWRGNLFIGGMAGQQLSRLTLNGQRVVNEEALVQQMGRIRDIRQGPDGFIYLVTDDREAGQAHAGLNRLNEPTPSEPQVLGSLMGPGVAVGHCSSRCCFIIQRTCTYMCLHDLFA